MPDGSPRCWAGTAASCSGTCSRCAVGAGTGCSSPTVTPPSTSRRRNRSAEPAPSTGRGPGVLGDLEGRRPLMRDEDVVALGFRGTEESAAAGVQPLPAAPHAMDPGAVRARGADRAARRAVGLLAGAGAGYWVHLDADVLDDALRPVVGHRIPGGLTWEELETVLRTALGGRGAAGFDVTVLDPRLDPDGSIAAHPTACLVRALAPEDRRGGPLTPRGRAASPERWRHPGRTWSPA